MFYDFVPNWFLLGFFGSYNLTTCVKIFACLLDLLPSVEIAGLGKEDSIKASATNQLLFLSY